MFLFYLAISTIVFSELFKSNRLGLYTVFFGVLLNFLIIQFQFDSVFLRVTTYFYIPLLFSDWTFIGNPKKKYNLLWIIPFLVIYIYTINLKTYEFDEFGSMLPYKTYLIP